MEILQAVGYLGADQLGVVLHPSGPRILVIRDNRVLGGLGFLSGQDRLTHPDVSDGTPHLKDLSALIELPLTGRHGTPCPAWKNRLPCIRRRLPPPRRRSTRVSRSTPIPSTKLFPGPAAGLSAIHQGRCCGSPDFTA
ncbi:hypothetical protein [Streptomyces sp. NBC_00496]|uniref:hypothetical protein n=1 Tax=Streptomyces sp. NBC_00496 TaxID=2903658 RepID=UPI002E188C03